MRSGAVLAPSLSGGGPWLQLFLRRSPAAAMFVSDCRREFYEVVVSQVRAAGRDRGAGGVTAGVAAAGGAVSPQTVPAASRSGGGTGASPALAAAAEALRSSWAAGGRGCRVPGAAGAGGGCTEGPRPR